MSPTLSSKELHIMTHARGWDAGAYRNHFVTGPGADNWEPIQHLCSLGLMQQTRGPSEFTGGYHSFCVTDDGDKAITAYVGPAKKKRSGR